MFIVALFTIAKTWKQTKCPSTDEWIKKMWNMHVYIYIYMCVCAYIYNGILLSQKEWNSAIFRHIVDLENIILSEVSQTERNKCYMILHTCGVLKIVQMNLFIKDKQIQGHRKQTYDYPNGEAGKAKLAVHITTYKRDKHKEVYSISCNNLQWERIGKKNI